MILQRPLSAAVSYAFRLVPLSFIAGLGLYFSTGRAVDASSLYVATNGIPSGNRDRWSSAYTNIQDALDAATNGNTIYLAGHAFVLTNQLVWTAKTNVTIRGGYAATNDLDQPGPFDARQWPTVLNAAGSDNRVLMITNVTGSALERIVFTGGIQKSANGTAGGGLFIVRSPNLLLSACVITNNLADTDVSGGGLAIASSIVTITNCVVKNNSVKLSNSTTARYGGGIYLVSGTATVWNTVIAMNAITNGYNRYGGGLSSAGTCVLRNCLVVGNSVGGRGDGLYVGGGALRVENCTVADNAGQGIHQGGGTVSVTNSIIWGNGINLTGTVALAWSNVEDREPQDANGNRSANPLFERGYYLGDQSPCIDAGTNSAAVWGLDSLTTQVGGAGDSGRVDMGYHYPSGYDLNGATLYVATNGNNTAGTNWTTAYRTLTQALAAVRDGSQVHIGPGAYTNGAESFPLTLANVMGVQILGAHSSNTLVNATGSNTRVISLTRCSGMKIAGVTFAGGYLPSIGNGSGLSLLNCGGINLSDCVIRNNSAGASGNGGGLYADASSVTLSYCQIVSNTLRVSSTVAYYGAGVYARNGFVTMQNTIVASNSISGGSSRNGGGIAIIGAGCALYNCLIARNTSTLRGDGLYFDSSSPFQSLDNCTVVNNAGQGLFQTNGTSTVSNSIFWANGDDLIGNIILAYSCIENGDNKDVDGCIDDNPLFANTNALDYRLTQQSPCLDKGLNAGWMLTALDLDSTARIRGARVDMGAYEFPVPQGTVILFQ